MDIGQQMEAVAAEIRAWAAQSQLPPASAVALAAYEQAEQMDRMAIRWRELVEAGAGE